MVAGAEMVDGLLDGKRPDRDATAKPLGQADRIGLHPKLLVTPEASAPAHADLHLIKDQQDVALIAELAHPPEEGRIAGVYPPFTLQGLEHHGSYPGATGFGFGKQSLKSLRVVVRKEAESFHHRLEALVVAGLTGGAHRRQCAAVEAGLGREDDRPLNASHEMAMLAGQLDRRFVGLGSGITEKDAIGAAAAGDPGGEQFLFRDPVQVGDML